MPDPTSDTLDRIHDRIAQAAPAGVWSRADFLDIGTPNAVEKVLHAPTVRVKELASLPGGDQYASALRELFDLDPATAESVAAVK